MLGVCMGFSPEILSFSAQAWGVRFVAPLSRRGYRGPERQNAMSKVTRRRYGGARMRSRLWVTTWRWDISFCQITPKDTKAEKLLPPSPPHAAGQRAVMAGAASSGVAPACTPGAWALPDLRLQQRGALREEMKGGPRGCRCDVRREQSRAAGGGHEISAAGTGRVVMKAADTWVSEPRTLASSPAEPCVCSLNSCPGPTRRTHRSTQRTGPCCIIAQQEADPACLAPRPVHSGQRAPEGDGRPTLLSKRS